MIIYKDMLENEVRLGDILAVPDRSDIYLVILHHYSTGYGNNLIGYKYNKEDDIENPNNKFPNFYRGWKFIMSPERIKRSLKYKI